MKTELIKTWRGYQIKVYDGIHKYLYVKGYYKGVYKYTQDFTYARYYSLKTAKEHARRIENM